MKYKHVEIAIATIIFILAVTSILGSANNYLEDSSNAQYNVQGYAMAGLTYNYFLNYLLPTVLSYIAFYTAFLWVAVGKPDQFITRRDWIKTVIVLAAGWLVLWVLLTIQDCLLKPYRPNILMHSLLIEIPVATSFYLFLIAYQAVKQLVFWLLSRQELKQSLKNNQMMAEIVWFILLWGICLLACLFLRAYWGVTYAVVLMLPCIFLVYLANVYWLIPQYFKKIDNVYFWALTGMVVLAINIPLNGLYTARATHNRYLFAEFFLLFWFLQLIVITPISVFIYQSRQQRRAELTGLQTNLGTTSANLQYLRSQINPHFLFNALNTLYGTALVEKAEKTGEGIQKLGDMMRFMLHENNQDRIALSRELEYIHNYIDLQTMRLALSPDVTVEIQIEDIIGYAEIAPMLLIPFIENAYKHGISFQERSWININLYKQENQLHLDVHNSVHPVNLNDPERFQSGTGLDNVKQRLQLLYPGKHELVVRQNTKEFFVHLTLTLSNLNG